MARREICQIINRTRNDHVQIKGKNRASNRKKSGLEHRDFSIGAVLFGGAFLRTNQITLEREFFQLNAGDVTVNPPGVISHTKKVNVSRGVSQNPPMQAVNVVRTVSAPPFGTNDIQALGHCTRTIPTLLLWD